jgi:preprotein translocase subunit SecA
MFGKLMDSIDDDYLRYVMHVQVMAAPADDPDFAQAAFQAADDPAAGLDELSQVPAAELAGASGTGPQAAPAVQSGGRGGPPHEAGAAGASGATGQSGRPQQQAAGSQGGNGGNAQKRPPSGTISPTGTRLVGGPPAKVGRNEPCWCGSGRKFKVCHGAS